MACALTAISSVDCAANEGGIIRSFVAKLSDITAATVTSGVISNFTMASTGLWKAIVYDKDATANYGQVGALNGNRYQIEQTAFLKFGGLTAAYIAAADNASACCDVVFIHILANGLRLVQGLESLAATGTPVSTNGRRTRITASILTGTSAEEVRMEFTVAGQSNTMSQTTSLTDAAIAAL